MRLRKIFYFSSIVVIFIVNCLYVEYQFAVLLALALLVPIISYIYYFIANAGMRITVTNNGPVIASDEKIVLKVSAAKKFIFAVPWAKASVGIYYSNCDEHIKKHILLETVWTGVPQKTLKFKPVHCGIVNLRINELTVRDFLAFFESRYQFNLTRKIVVLPELVRVNKDDFGNGEFIEEYIESYNETDNTEVMNLRDYRDGDKITKIHWKKSFLLDDEIVVKEYGEEISRRNLIVVDLSYNEKDTFRDELDLIYKYTFAIANCYLEEQAYATVVAWDGKKERNAEFIVTNAEELMNMMVSLMSLRCDRGSVENVVKSIALKPNESGTKPLLITACDIDISQYEVINVCKDTIEDVLTWVE